MFFPHVEISGLLSPYQADENVVAIKVIQLYENRLEYEHMIINSI